MNTLINTTSNTQDITISSLEIAKITGKDHYNVLRDIRAMLNELEIDALSFEVIFLDSMNRQQTMYSLTRRLAECLVTGYSVKLRMAVLDRLHELESQVQQPKLPTTYLEALQHLVVSEQEKQEALKQVAALEVYVQEAAPAVALHKVISNSDQAITMGEFAAVVKERTGLGRNNMFKRLRGLNILQPNNTPYARFSKYFKTVETYRGGNIVIVTLVRVDSQEYLINRLV